MGSIKGGLLQNHLIPAWNVTICRNKSGFLFNKLFITSLSEHKFYKKKQGLSLINISSFSTYLGRRPWHTSEWNVQQAGSIQPHQSHGMGSGKSLCIWGSEPRRAAKVSPRSSSSSNPPNTGSSSQGTSQKRAYCFVSWGFLRCFTHPFCTCQLNLI